MDNYEPVDDRIHKFWDQYPDGRIVTHLEEIKLDDNGRILNVVVRTEVFKNYDEHRRPDATGYAEETAGISTAPKGSLLETCETSSIGRALANLGLSAKGNRPSREEMEKAERHAGTDETPASEYRNRNDQPRKEWPQDQPDRGYPPSEKQLILIGDLITQKKLDAVIPRHLTKKQASDAIDILRAGRVPDGWGLDAAEQYEEEEPF